MEIKLLKDALTHYVATAECSQNDQVAQCLHAFAELTEAERAIANAGHDWYAIYPVPCMVIDELVNQFFYDTIGKLIKANTYGMTVDQIRASTYMQQLIMSKAVIAIQESHELLTADQLPYSTLESGIQMVIDLWLDNEANGDNNPDGTFNPDASHHTLSTAKQSPTQTP